MAVALDNAWIAAGAAAIAKYAEEEIEALVAISSPSGDVAGAERAVAAAIEMLPAAATAERIECSSDNHADDLLATIAGSGAGRLLLLGHLDTVVSHAEHRPAEATVERLTGSGTIDMKGGDALALGVLRVLADARERFAEVALLLVTDEEWRTGPLVHGPRFAGYDACLCFEGGELTADGDDAVVVRRKAAATARVRARGIAAHSGASPERGRNALLALAAAAQAIAAVNDPDGPDRVTAVPTVLRSGDAFNVVPAEGELICDLRGESLGALEKVLDAVPASLDGVELSAELVRRWPGMDTREVAAPVLARAAELLGRPLVASERGGASDASHLAAHVPLSIDGLGPLGAGAHSPDEYVLRASLLSRSEVALAIAAAVIERPGTGP